MAASAVSRPAKTTRTPLPAALADIVTCAPCWGCVAHRGVEPLALPAARQKMAGFPAGPGCARLRDDYLLHLPPVTP
jgi:hypothetical protein